MPKKYKPGDRPISGDWSGAFDGDAMVIMRGSSAPLVRAVLSLADALERLDPKTKKKIVAAWDAVQKQKGKKQ